MAYGTQIKRYIHVFERLNLQDFPSLKQLKEYLLRNDFDVSKKTVRRILIELKNEFGLDIIYNINKKGYEITSDNNEISYFTSFIQLFSKTQLRKTMLNDDMQVSEYVLFDTDSNFKGSEYLQVIYKAIKQNTVLEITHTGYHKKQTNQYRIEPYLLKEYNNRWYVVALRDGQIRTFGLDRIDELKLTRTTFTRNEGLCIAEKFINTIGIIYGDEKVETLELSFTELQGNYVKSLPLHHSQKTIIDTQQEFRCTIDVVINPELKNKILKFGSSIKVIQPTHLKEEIKAELLKSLSNYQ